jgi:hypothetical protein
MKKFLTFAAIAMIGLFAFSGCTKKSDSPSYTMKATVGSTAFSVNNCYGLISGTSLSIFGYSASGTTATYPNITIVDFNYTAPGTYDVSTSGTSMVTMAYYPSSDPSAIKSAQTGTLTIATVTTTTITGTFSFTCTDGTVVSNGSFTARRS